MPAPHHCLIVVALLSACAAGATGDSNDPFGSCEGCDLGGDESSCARVVDDFSFHLENGEATPDHASGQVIGGSMIGAIEWPGDFDWYLLPIWDGSVASAEVVVDDSYPDLATEVCMFHLNVSFESTSPTCVAGTRRQIDGMSGCCQAAEPSTIPRVAIDAGTNGNVAILVRSPGEECGRYRLKL